MDKSKQLNQLIDGAEELLTNLTDAHDPAIQNLRDKVDDAIGAARRAIEKQSDAAAVQLRDIANTIDDYVHDYPWLAFATGALVAGTVAFIAGLTIGTKKQPEADED